MKSDLCKHYSSLNACRPTRRRRWLTAGGSVGVLTALTLVAQAATVTVTIENLAPDHGTYLTPAFVAFHDGTFDTFNPGEAASAALERIAEDGNTDPISTAFMTSGAGTAHATVPGPNGPIAPGETATLTLTLDGSDPANRYFSFVSMVIPSNDAFIGNGSPMAFPIFDDMGHFTGLERMVSGAMVWDAGTEVNDEVPANTAFFGQAGPNIGVAEGGVVAAHAGYLPAGSGGILDDPMFASADFSAEGYVVARVTVSLADADGDGVPDDFDACADTAAGAAVDDHGCSIAQLVPCEGPKPGKSWRNHGHYVSTVAHVAIHFARDGRISRPELWQIIRAAARSDCGKAPKRHRVHPWFRWHRSHGRH